MRRRKRGDFTRRSAIRAGEGHQPYPAHTSSETHWDEEQQWLLAVGEKGTHGGFCRGVARHSFHRGLARAVSLWSTGVSETRRRSISPKGVTAQTVTRNSPETHCPLAPAVGGRAEGSLWTLTESLPQTSVGWRRKVRFTEAKSSCTAAAQVPSSHHGAERPLSHFSPSTDAFCTNPQGRLSFRPPDARPGR